MTNTTAIDEQSLVDIAIEKYGSVAGLVELALLNGKSITSLLQVGEVLQVGEAVNKDVVQYFKERNLKVATGQRVIILPAPTSTDFNSTDFNSTDFN